MPRTQKLTKDELRRALRPLILAALTVARQMLDDEAQQARTEPTPETHGVERDR